MVSMYLATCPPRVHFDEHELIRRNEKEKNKKTNEQIPA